MTDIATHKLSSPLVRVTRADGTELQVQTANPDLVLWDMTRTKHRWPKFDEAPFLWLTFIAWAAARRTAAIPADLTWDQWRADVLDVADASDSDEANPELGSPTPPGHEPG